MARNLNAPENWYHWLKACLKDGAPVELGKHSLGMLTGQDKRCLGAIAACWHLYAGGDDDGRRAALEAIRALLPGMQRKCWMFARELIPQSMDWHNRAQLWPRVALAECDECHDQKPLGDMREVTIAGSSACVCAGCEAKIGR
jgi:hypothetical protein